MQIRNYKQAIEYLDSFVKPIVFARIRPDDAKLNDPLDRMRVLLRLLGDPQNKFKSIQVSGTSGKGSTAYLISHILTIASYKTGFTMSPHLEKVNERIQINENNISDKEFIDLLNQIIPAIEQMKGMSFGEPSYFEITMAMAFLHFAQKRVDIAVVEVGMEGKYDASNTLNPIFAVLTNIDLDHTEILGNTVEEIALEAIEIIKKLPSKKEQIVVTGVKQPKIIKIVEERVKKVGARLYRLGKDFYLTNLKVSLLGDYQKENASLAVETILQLKKFGFRVSINDIRKALSSAFFPGRFEYLIHNTKYKILLDGAHNPAKMRAFLTSLSKLYPKKKPASLPHSAKASRDTKLRGPRKIFVVGFKSDKDVANMLYQISRVADKIIATRFHVSLGYVANGAMESKDIRSKLSKINNKRVVNVSTTENSKIAMDKAFQLAKKDDLIVVTGSLYLVGEVRNML